MKVLFAFLLVGGVIAIPVKRSFRGNADKYVDEEILGRLRQLIKDEHLDPLALPEESVGFSHQVWIVTFHGEAKVYNGKLHGLSTLHRTGDCDLNMEGEKITLAANIGVYNLKAQYSARASFMNIGVGASADVTLSYVNVYFKASMKMNSGRGLKLEKFDITNTGKLHANVYGLGPLNFILELLVNFVGNIAKGAIINAIEGPIHGLLQNVVSGLVPPIPF